MVQRNQASDLAYARNKREAERLAALDYLDAVRPEVDHVLQELVDDVRGIFGTDLCNVNLILSDVQYFRAWSGEFPADLAEARQDPRERSMCQHVVAIEAPVVVPDLLATEEFRDHHFCVNYGIRFYTGVPLITSDGHAVGVLCLQGSQPRELSEDELILLKTFARAVVGRLELLGALRREQAAKDEEAQRARVLQQKQDASLDMVTDIGLDGVFKTMNAASKTIMGYETEELVGRNLMDLLHPDDRDCNAELTAAIADGSSEARL